MLLVSQHLQEGPQRLPIQPRLDLPRARPGTQSSLRKGLRNGDFETKEGTIEEHWIKWSQQAETYLCRQEDKRGKEFKGRGQK
eukprot:236924-Heterocapsa_arctica.AAC.1